MSEYLIQFNNISKFFGKVIALNVKKGSKVKTGDVVIFPGWMLHRTGKNLNDDPRITINTNVIAFPTPITPNTPKPISE